MLFEMSLGWTDHFDGNELVSVWVSHDFDSFASLLPSLLEARDDITDQTTLDRLAWSCMSIERRTWTPSGLTAMKL